MAGKLGGAALGLRAKQVGEAAKAKAKAAALADSLSDVARNTLPSEQISKQVPMAAGIPTGAAPDEEQMVSGVDYEEGLAVPIRDKQIGDRQPVRERIVEGFDQDPRSTELQFDPDDPSTFAVTPETEERLRREQLIKLSQSGAEVGTMTPDEAVAMGQEELRQGYFPKTGALLSDEGARNFGNFVDNELAKKHYRDFSIADNTPLFSVETGMENAAQAFKIDSGNMNLWGNQIANAQMTPEEIGNVARAQDIIRENANLFTYIIKSDDKLAMSENDADPNSPIRGEFGRTAFLAVLLELGNRLNLQSTEIDKKREDKFYDNALDRSVFGKAVANRIEQMLYHSGDIDASSFTGETTKFGFQSRLTEDEKAVLGSVIVQGFADSPLYDWIQTVPVKGDDGKTKYTYVTTDEGAFQVPRMRREVLRQLGMQGHDRPVSLVPTDEGRMISESAYSQKEITRQVVPNRLTKKVRDGINALSKVAHTVSPHKVTLFAGIMASAMTNNTGAFAKFTKQDPQYLTDKRDELFDKFMKQYNNRELRAQDIRGLQDIPNPTREQVELALKDEAFRQAQRIQRIHFKMRAETLADGANRIGNAFYYGYTAINNSSRMMISQTELNYQADKVARFLVDGANEVVVEKGSNSRAENGFKQVLARSLVIGADKMLPKDQVAMLMADMDKMSLRAQQVMNYMNAVGGKAKRVPIESIKEPGLELENQIKSGAIIPLENYLDNTTIDFLKSHGKDGFYFALDALHELGRYNNNKAIKTRLKAEIDGNANGAVIQAMQMGLVNILQRGGVIYSNAEDLEKDIRDEVFDSIEQNVKSQPGRPHEALIESIRSEGLIKDLLKLPIMTSIYGKDPEFHGDTANDFYESNRTLFVDMEREEAVEFLREQIEYGLKHKLGGALEHAKIMKRMGRAFNFANQIAQIRGANDFYVQAGGWEYTPTAVETFTFGDAIKQPGVQRAGQPLQTDFMKVELGRSIPSAQAEAKGAIQEDGRRSDPGVGSKLRNQIAVNGTQNIDATIAQETVARVAKNLPNNNIMQVYDAFMGDAISFPLLRETSNDVFKRVNADYSMVDAEIAAFNALIASVRDEVKRKTKEGTDFDIGTAGEYASLGDFISNYGSIINRDFTIISGAAATQNELEKKKSNAYNAAAVIAQEVPEYNVRFPPKHFRVDPEKFLRLFNKSVNALQIKQDLTKFRAKVKANKAEAEMLMAKFLQQFS